MDNEFEAEILELYNKYGDAIFFFCVSRLYDNELATEAAAEVFLKLIEKYSFLRKKCEKENAERIIRNWLYGTAKNSISRQRRHAKRQREIVQQIVFSRSKPINQDDSDKKEKLNAIYNAVRKLNPDDQEIIMLRFLHGCQTSVIAEIIGIEHAATRARLSRVIRKIQTMLGIEK